MRGRREEGSFALVSTLLIVAVMAMGALAFFQAARMDRLVSRNTADRVRAELAAESGLAAATALLRLETTNDTFVITLNPTNRQLFSGNQRGAGRAAGFSYRPLFSVGSNLAGLFINPISTTGQPATNLLAPVNRSFTNPTAIFTNQLPGGLFVTSPVVSWVYLTNAQGATNARFAFWIEDLGGRLDLSSMGTTNTTPAGGRIKVAAPSTRPTGTNVEEIALWSLFSPNSAQFVTNAAARLVENRSALLTPAGARLLDATAVTTNTVADLTAGLFQDTNEVEVIPHGLGYADAGRAKYNINDYIRNGNVAAVAAIISSNLPNFEAQRKGGFPAGENYVQTLAASAIDYADADSTPSVGSGYRGVDSAPFTTVIYNQYDWYEKTVTNIQIRVSTFIQLWNISDQTISGDFTLVETNQDTIQELGWSPGVTSQNLAGLTFQPNEVRVLKFQQNTNIPTGVFPIAGENLTIAANTQYTFGTRWNGAVCDQMRTPGERIQKTLELQPSSGGPDWSGFLPGLRYLPYTTTLSNQQCGDPRSTYYLAATLAANDFDARAAWGGLAVMRPAAGRYQTQPWLWADPITNDAVSMPAPTSSSSLSTKFTEVSELTNGSRPGMAAYAPQKINNTGSYRAITELGNIYDPAQWSYAGYPSNSIPSDASADSNYGGGFSLRIGKAEHPKFTNDGTRASQLLDLFAAGPPSTAGGRVAPLTSVTNRIAPRINLNTATTNTLRALAAGVYLTNDPAMVPGGTNFVVPVAAVENFITAVTNFRSQRPFLASSQLNELTLPGGTFPDNAIFGNRNFGSGAAVVTQWHDAAAEEWFSKVYPLTAVRSRNFLVHVVGQAVATNTGRPMATFRRVSQISAEPLRASDTGLTTNVSLKILRSWQL